uniref:Uncharacterized protein n=1 Tax=Oryza rufipogon TaxID=4529 RepID=A0A0E0NXJ5_ORYRU
MEKLILQAKQSAAAMQLLRDELVVLGDKLNEMVPEKELSQIEEFESYLGCSIPSQIEIHPPNDTRSRGRIKRIKGHNDKEKKQNKKRKKKERVPRRCKKCKQVVLHDSRNCPNKEPQHLLGAGSPSCEIITLARVTIDRGNHLVVTSLSPLSTQ